ncbi:MAG: hypothetical protein AB1744_06120, partial [Candidatus Zixiibacteriota bacterium]
MVGCTLYSWAADVLRLSQKPVLLEINPIRVAAELVSAVEGTALGATQGRPLRDEKKVAPYAM